MRCVTSYIRGREEPIRRNLLLKAEVPGMFRRRWRIVSYNEIVSEWQIRRIGIDFTRRERIPAGEATPRILKPARRECVNDTGGPWQRDVGGVEGSCQHLIAHRIGSANRHAAIAAWIPGETYARCDMGPVVFDPRPVANS